MWQKDKRHPFLFTKFLCLTKIRLDFTIENLKNLAIKTCKVFIRFGNAYGRIENMEF